MNVINTLLWPINCDTSITAACYNYYGLGKPVARITITQTEKECNVKLCNGQRLAWTEQLVVLPMLKLTKTRMHR